MTDTPGKAAVRAAVAAGVPKSAVDTHINIYAAAEPTISRVLDDRPRLARIRDQARAHGDDETADFIDRRLAMREAAE